MPLHRVLRSGAPKFGEGFLISSIRQSPAENTPSMIQNQKDYIAATIGLAVLLIILTWASCDRIEKRFDRVYSDLSAQMRVIESKLDEVKENVDRLK
jgi:hypothetical protein